jgi:hydrogenase maturation protease
MVDAARAAAGEPSRPLVIGYGNCLRRDDGVGWHVATTIADDPAAGGIDVIAAHQLTPELAYDLHLASRAVLVDAAVDDAAAGLPPGRCVISHLPPVGGPAEGGVSSHHCTPRALAALAVGLYGSVAPITLVGVGVASIEDGEALSAEVADRLPSVVATVLDLINGRSPAPSPAKEPEHA